MGEKEHLDRYQELAFKQFNGTITPSEAEELSAWLNTFDNVPFEIDDPEVDNIVQHERRLWKKISTSLFSKKPAYTLLLKWMAAACVAMLLFGASRYFLRSDAPVPQAVTKIPDDVLPGSHGAILTLADGSRIVLDSIADGIIADQNGTRVMLNNGVIQYAASQLPGEQAVLNTISTPKGRSFQLALPDGTTVWLNAESSITYPTAFNEGRRQVSITGEAYFEVVKDTNLFQVRTSSVVVEVLGTRFNINGYEDEQFVHTTLVEGGVRVSRDGQQILLKPGEQARTSRSGDGEIIVRKADVEEVVGWKDGLFCFSDTDLRSVMRTLSKWYDVDIIYEGTVPEKRLVGIIPKKIRLSAVLQSLAYTGVNFRIEGRNIIVSPK